MELYERPSQTTLIIFPTPFLFLFSHGVVSQAAPRSLGGRPSSTSSLDRRALKAASSETDRCLALRRSARHSLSHTPSYSTYNTTSYNSGARPHIWKNDTYSGQVYKNGYSHGPEIFKAMEAAKNKDTAAKKI
jgi:hypothetical protein